MRGSLKVRPSALVCMLFWMTPLLICYLVRRHLPSSLYRSHLLTFPSSNFCVYRGTFSPFYVLPPLFVLILRPPRSHSEEMECPRDQFIPLKNPPLSYVDSTPLPLPIECRQLFTADVVVSFGNQPSC